MTAGIDILEKIFQTNASRFEELGTEFDLYTVSLHESKRRGGELGEHTKYTFRGKSGQCISSMREGGFKSLSEIVEFGVSRAHLA
jgi:hypothetical protein